MPFSGGGRGKRCGSWDGPDDKYAQAAGFAKNLYVQPYIFKGSKEYGRTDAGIMHQIIQLIQLSYAG